MITFKQKSFSEFDAMRSLFVELNRNAGPNKFQMIKLNSLLPILKGNNVVIERFVISTGLLKRDTYRMYLKIGAKAKLPEEVRLPSYERKNSVLGLRFKVGAGLPGKKYFSESEEQKEFGKGGDKAPKLIDSGIDLYPDLSYTTNELKGETLKYNKAERSLVLEFPDIRSAIDALNILPFGLNYKVYLLDV